MPIAKQFGVAALSLAMSGCAGTQVIHTQVKQIITPECEILNVATKAVDGEVKGDPVTYANQEQPYAIRCGGERELAAKQLAETRIKEAKIKAAYEILAIGAAHELSKDNPDPAFTKQLVALIDSQTPEISAAAHKTLEAQKLTEDDLRKRVALDEINRSISLITAQANTPNMIPMAYLLDAYDGITYKNIDRGFIQNAIDEKLAEHGLAITDIRSDYRQYGPPRVGGCQVVPGQNGFFCGPSGAQ